MNIKNLLFIFVVTALSVSTFVHAEKCCKPWTVVIYMAAANNLHTVFMNQLKTISALRESPYVNVLVYLTMKHPDGNKQTKKLHLAKGGLQLVGPILERDSGHVASLAEALQWALLDYPSEHIAVILAGNGSGVLNTDHMIKGICYDVDSGNYLTDKDCHDAFQWINSKLMNGKKIDIIACDASYFSSVEIAYTFAPFADYLVAPEGVISEKRFPYALFLAMMGKMYQSPEACVRLMVDIYGKRLQPDELPLSAIDLADVDNLVANMNSIAQILCSHLQGKYSKKTKGIIRKCVNKNICPSFFNGLYIDLATFYQNLLRNSDMLKLSQAINSQTKKLLITGSHLIKRMVYRGTKEETANPLGGLAVYFARKSVNPSYYGLHWVPHNGAWLNFLELFIEQ